MNTIAAIRTHRWDEDAERIAAQLRPVFGDRLVVVFHNRPKRFDPGLPVVDVNNFWVRRQGLRVLPDWGWRCGDYFAYALRAARPEFDRYWLIEPDVWFAGDPAAFFAEAEAIDCDLLGTRVEPLPPRHRFSRGMAGADAYRAIFALTRFSGRALDHLLPARQAYAAGRVPARFFSNDEVFCYSTAVADPAMTTAGMAELMPDWFPPESMRTDPDILIETLTTGAAQGVYHPVRDRESFKRAVAARIAESPAFLGAMRPSLARLTDSDVTDIAAAVAASMAAKLRDIARTDAETGGEASA